MPGTIKREADHVYYILEAQEEIEEGSYPVRMLSAGIIPSVIPLQIQRMDGQSYLYYDVTALQPLRTMIEGRSSLLYRELKQILEECLDITEKLSDFLIPADTLLLTADQIFTDPQREKLFFCCFPGNGTEIRQSFRLFAEYLLNHIDHKDGRAVEAGYGFYKMLMGGEVPLEMLRRNLYPSKQGYESASGRKPPVSGVQDGRHGDKHAEESLPGESGPRGETGSFLRDGYQPEIVTTGDGKVINIRKRWVLIGSLALGVLWFLLTMLISNGTLPEIPLDMLLLNTGVVMAVLTFAGWLYGRIRKKKPGQEEESRAQGPAADRSFYDMPAAEPEPGGEQFTKLTFDDLSRDSGEDFTKAFFHDAPEEKKGEAYLEPEDPSRPRIRLDRNILMIGSMTGVADAKINSPAVSRVHARITRRDDACCATDLHSKNGTKLNGVLLSPGQEYPLQPNDTLTFADVSYRIVLD